MGELIFSSLITGVLTIGAIALFGGMIVSFFSWLWAVITGAAGIAVLIFLGAAVLFGLNAAADALESIAA